MDPGETIKEASEREVFEETGIKCDFVGLLGIRELLQFKYGCTDLYIVCLLRMQDG
jgi:ADP-ribose pyrophosphatase YjhB (NUDIX family)